MPRRWLSLRTQKEEHSFTPPVAEGFDFAFGVKSDSPLSSPTSPDSKRPFIFGDAALKARRKPDLTLLIERPQNSRPSSRFSGSFSGPRSGNSCIGVAFGSPHHPPQNFGASQLDMTSSRPCLADNSSPVRSPSVKKWKKIGGLFRPRANSDKSSVSYQQQFDNSHHKLDASVHKSRWRSPKSPPAVQDDAATHHRIATSGSNQDRPRTSHGYQPRKSQSSSEIHPFPSIQVRIPGSPFERYSVMFKNLNATPQLGRRRSYMKEDIIPDPSPVQPIIDTNSPTLKRRVTSPSLSQTCELHKVEGPPSNPKPVNSSRYSLFPATPNTSRPQSQHRSLNNLSNRPWTAHGQVSSPQDGSPQKRQRHELSVSNATVQSIDLQKELPCLAPEPNTKISAPLTHSRRSSSGEIFFGVKSLRDSKGLDLTHYEIARPPSTELLVARSRSDARKQSRRPSDPSTTTRNHREQPSKTTCTQIDDAVALVESITSAASASAVTAEQEHNSITPKKLASQHRQMNGALSNDTTVVVANSKRLRTPRSKSDGLNIAVPSPVLESIEEVSPRTINSRHSIALMTEGPAIASLDMIKSRARANSNDNQISRAQLRKELPLPPPPPPVVPIKDSQFIPLSKYAPRHTAEELVRQTGLRPVRPSRSNTDDGVSYNGGITVFRRQLPPTRSCTMPSTYVPIGSKEGSSHSASVTRRISPRPDQEIPAIVVYTPRSAEVSVARTVSLSRKPSAKITVSRQPSRNALRQTNRSEEELAEKKVAQRMSTLLEANGKHKSELNQNAVVEMETTIPSSPTCGTAGCDFARTLDVFPTPPMLSV